MTVCPECGESMGVMGMPVSPLDHTPGSRHCLRRQVTNLERERKDALERASNIIAKLAEDEKNACDEVERLRGAIERHWIKVGRGNVAQPAENAELWAVLRSEEP